MDLAVDEQGLWALWGDTDNARRLYASKIDVYSNAIIHTRALTTGTSISVIHLFLIWTILTTENSRKQPSQI